MTQNTFSDTTNVGEDFIQHHGVKGMKWGVRRDLKKLPTKKARESYIAEKDSKWRAKTEDPKKAIRASRRASREATRMTRELNKKYKGMGYKLKGNSLRKNNINNRKNRLVRNQYDIELKGVIESSLDSAAYKVYKNSPSRLYQVDLSRDLDGTVSAKITPRQNAKLDKQRASITNKARKMKHSDEGTQDLYVKMEEDEDGFIVDIQLPEFDLELAEDEVALDHSDLSDLGSDFLMHYGVKGMKWGVRKNKDGKVTSVVKRTPFRGTNEYDGPNADGKAVAIKEYADPKVLTGLKRIYKDARVPINRGLKSLNKSDKYKDADLTDSKSKVFKDYHDDVSNLVKEKLYASTTLKLRDNDRFVIDHYDYDSREDSAPRLGTVVSTVYTPERRTPDSKEFADSVKYRHNTRVNDITDAAKSDGLNYIATAALSTALGQPIGIGPLLVGVTSTAYKVDSRREKSERANEYMKSRKVRHSGLDENADPQDFILSFGYARNGFIEDVKMEVKPRKLGHSDLSELGSDFLMHHGVKGMKWGVRKDGKPRGYQGPSSTKKKVKKAIANVVDPDKRAKRKLQKAKSKYERQRLNEQASGYEKAAEESKKNSRENEKASDPSPKPKSKPVAELSDDELRQVIQRIDLEKRYATLMEERRPKSRTEKVNKFLKKAATEAAENAAKQLITKGVGAAVTRATGVPVNGANAKAATNALKTAANDATKDVTKAAQNQAAAQPKTPSEPTPKGNAETNSPKAPRTPFTRGPLAPIKTKNVSTVASPTKSPSFSDILSKSYNDTITSGTTQKGNSWLDEFDTNRDFVTLNEERRKRR